MSINKVVCFFYYRKDSIHFELNVTRPQLETEKRGCHRQHTLI